MKEKIETSVLRLYWQSPPGKGNAMKALALAGIILMCAGTLTALYMLIWTAFYLGVAM